MNECSLCKNKGYVQLPVGYTIAHDFLSKTNFAYKICPVCKGYKKNIFNYPFSIEACEWLEDYKSGS